MIYKLPDAKINMDFLDPRKKRSHRKRLMLGYVLLSIAIGLGTMILVYAAYGYSLNTKTGDIIENGLLFVDSQPSGAEVYLNGKDQNTTSSARKVLPAGAYSLRLTKAGYRDWSRNFILDEHRIARYVYPFLFPAKPTPNVLKKYAVTPSLVTNSPDRHWLITFNSSGDGDSFELFDTSDLKAVAQPLAVPAGLLSASDQPASYKLMEWSTDNKHVVVERMFTGGTEYLVIDRSNPASSFNVNKRFNVTPQQVALRDKKIDQLYLYVDGSLRLGDTSAINLAPIFLKDVLAFKAYGADLLLYVSKISGDSTQAQAKIWDNGKSYNLYKFPVGEKYLIDVAKFQGDFYYVAGSSTGDYINVFKNPLDGLKDSKVAKALPLITLRENNAQKVSFSANARFVAAQADQNFAVYDIEENQYYRYIVPSELSTPLLWMDGHRFIGASGGSVLAMDYDKTNARALVPTVLPEGGFFDREYQQMFTVSTATGGGANLVRVDMRAGKDLPN
jgi:PEGA domain